MWKTLEGSLALIIYFTSSVSATLVNKYIVSTRKFPMHYFLVLVQSAIIVAMVSFYYLWARKKPKVGRTYQWFIVSFFLTVMIFTNMKMVSLMPVTMYTLYKNLAIIPTALLEYQIFGKKITKSALVSFILLFGSSFMLYDPVEIPLAGYTWMISNNAATCFYMLYLKHVMVRGNASRADSVFFTNLLGIPILFLLSSTLDPLELMLDDVSLWVLIVFSSVTAFLTAFSTTWALKAVGSTSVSVIGTLNKLVLSAGGFLMFKETLAPLKATSLVVGLLASGLYSYDSVKNTDELPQSRVASR